MFDFIRVASAVTKVDVGNVVYNTEKIIEKIEEAKESKVDIIVFQELSITGYTCGDLFFQEKLLGGVVESVRNILYKSQDSSVISIIGAPLTISNQLYNCAIVIKSGKIEGIVTKTFLPNYNEFYEKRWFSSSIDLNQNYISSKILGISEDYNIPIGRDIIFNVNGKIKFGVEICEDLWTPLPPSTFLTLSGAEIIFNLSGSNETIAKRGYRRDLIRQQSARNLCGYVYCSTGCTESTTDLIYSGHSIIAENGSIIKENEDFIDTDYIIVSDIDVGKIRADRLKNKSFKDCSVLYGKHEESRTVNCNHFRELNGNGELYEVKKLPFVPTPQKDRLERCMNIFQMQVAGLEKRIAVTNSKVVIGVSGGLDSTLALLVCTQAMIRLKKPLTDIIGITLPSFGTSQRTYKNSLALMEKLGITSEEIDIRGACIQHCDDIGHNINDLNVTFENVQARERTQILMDYACKIGAFVVGTGDLSELALGWCTYNADHMSMYGVNSSIPKTLIRWMIDSIAQNNVFENSSEILKDIIDTPISPELLPPDTNGEIAQETESIIGPYVLHDFFLYYILRFGFSPEKIFYLATIAFKKDFEKKIILKWMKMFYRRFFTQQFKRNCLPDGVKVGSICLSPRGDWRMPSDACAKLWIDSIDRIEKEL